MLNPILVTGAYRSGTTWVGRMIAKSPSVEYIHEPFNIGSRALAHSRARCNAPFKYIFTYISDENEYLFYESIKNTLNFSYNLAEALKLSKSSLEALSHVKEYIISSRARFLKMRPLMKDPMALFSTEWLASKFNMDVIVLIRHPAAFAGSVKVKNWGVDFSLFLNQPLLMRDHLYPFEDEINEYVKKRHDIIDQAILFWKIAYYMVTKYKEKHRDWIFVRHEDISRDPLNGFKNIYKKLNLTYSNDIMKAINKHDSEENYLHKLQSTLFKRDSIIRDSSSVIWNWKKRLTKEEINRIKRNVEEISSRFYNDEDW